MTDPFTDDTAAELDRLRFALQSAQIGTWTLDIRQQRVWWDDQCKQLYGFRRDDIVPYDQVLSYMHEADRQRVDQAVRWALDPQSGGHYDVQFRTVGAEDGQIRWLHCRGRANFDGDGRAYRFAGTAQDITQQVVAHRKLEASETRFRALIRDAPMAMLVYEGPDQVMVEANQEMLAIFGRGDAVLGKPLLEAVPELRTTGLPGYYHRVLATGEPYYHPAEQIMLVKEGQPYWGYYNYTYKALFDEQGQAYGVVCTATDVTDQVQTQQALAESEARYRQLAVELDQQVQQRTQELASANKELTAINQELVANNEELEEANTLLTRSNDNLQTFAYIASHDLQEPLRKIQQFGNLLQIRFTGLIDEQSLRYLERMQGAASRMSLLIRDLLSFSRISTQRSSNAPVDLNQVVGEVVETMDLAVHELGAHLQVEPLPMVAGDGPQLGQLFQNLLSNALKFGRAGVAPQIRISSQPVLPEELPSIIKPTRRSPIYYRIEVVDNGIGFDEKYLDRIFQVFQRLHGKNEFAGAGIGLAIVEKVVTNHGGVITAFSQPGQGATFQVYLPA